MVTPKNIRSRPVTKLCLALETYRRTDEGRIRDAKAFLEYFFPVANGIATDRLFVHLPKEVRADLLSNWGIRGKKSALRDDDDKVKATVIDALAAGDIDAAVIEESVTAEILIDWIPLDDWWAFWRGASVPLGSIRKGLAIARELALFDDKWFLDSLKLPALKLERTDVLCAGLTKDQLIAWMHAVHESGDASPAGLVRALGWETILAKTAEAALGISLDALASERGLVHANAAPAKDAAPLKDAAALIKDAAPLIKDAAPLIKDAAPLIKDAAPLIKDAAPLIKDATPAKSGSYSKATVSQKVAEPRIEAAAAVRAPTAGALPSRSVPVTSAASAHLPSVVIDLDAARSEPKLTESAVPAPPASNPPTARALFGAPVVTELPPMRPPQMTLTGVGGPTPEDALVSVTMPTAPPGSDDPAWAPPRAEPGDMGWDLVHGVSMTISNVTPKYNFEADDEPTSEISLPGERR